MVGRGFEYPTVHDACRAAGSRRRTPATFFNRARVFQVSVWGGFRPVSPVRLGFLGFSHDAPAWLAGWLAGCLRIPDMIVMIGSYMMIIVVRVRVPVLLSHSTQKYMIRYVPYCVWLCGIGIIRQAGGKHWASIPLFNLTKFCTRGLRSPAV